MATKKLPFRTRKITKSAQLNRYLPGVYEVEDPIEVYKQVKCAHVPKKLCEFFLSEHTDKRCIATLEIPKGAQIAKASNNEGKYRASRAQIREITPYDENNKWAGILYNAIEARSNYYDPYFDVREDFYDRPSGYLEYNEGGLAIPSTFSHRNEQCASGIHFFVTREEAEDYRP